MLNTNLKVPPFNTTLMGVMRGVADAFGHDHTDAMLYGGSGHAFLINIHDTLCPSGPYCWRTERFDRLLRNLGIVRHHLGFLGGDCGPADRATIEATLKVQLDQGTTCALLNNENQLITGYDDSGFVTTQPWPHANFPPAHLTWGTWAELGDDIHISFFSFEPTTPATAGTIVTDRLKVAVDMLRNPTAYTDQPYGAGLLAYDKWLAAVEAGHGDAHGNWWNGIVWAECRARAADYLLQIGAGHPRAAEAASALADSYREIATALERASDRELEAAAKLEALRGAREAEADLAAGLEGLLAQLGTD